MIICNSNFVVVVTVVIVFWLDLCSFVALVANTLSLSVAAFHSLVGLAASAAAVGDYLNVEDTTNLDGVHLASIYLASVIGSVTFTGSLVAFGKLDGRLDSAPLKLGYRDQLNMGLGAATLGAGAVVMGAPEVGVGMISSPASARAPKRTYSVASPPSSRMRFAPSGNMKDLSR